MCGRAWLGTATGHRNIRPAASRGRFSFRRRRRIFAQIGRSGLLRRATAGIAFKSATGASGGVARGASTHARRHSPPRRDARRQHGASRADRRKQVLFMQCTGARRVSRDARRDAAGRSPRGRVERAGPVAVAPGLAFFSPGLLTAEKTVIRFRPADATCRQE